MFVSLWKVTNNLLYQALALKLLKVNILIKRKLIKRNTEYTKRASQNIKKDLNLPQVFKLLLQHSNDIISKEHLRI